MSNNSKPKLGADPPLELKKKLRDKHHQLLLMLARKGNEDAFRRLYRETHDPVTAYVNRRVMNSADAEDIIADVFQKFLLRLDSFDSDRGSARIHELDGDALTDLVRNDFPELANAEIMVEDLEGTITESWAQRFGREVLHIETDGATAGAP